VWTVCAADARIPKPERAGARFLRAQRIASQILSLKPVRS
jgi:hypothetical protein